MHDKWLLLYLNPEPWAVGDISAGRKEGRIVGRISPNPNLVAFQNAVKEALEGHPPLPPDYRRLEFFFFRQQARYIDAADRVRQRNQADATNLQKGLEDALQGVLFENDREINDVRSVIAQQGPNVKPLIVIHAQRTVAMPGIDEIPADILEEAMRRPVDEKKEDRWQDADELF